MVCILEKIRLRRRMTDIFTIMKIIETGKDGRHLILNRGKVQSLKRLYSTVLHYREQTNKNIYISKQFTCMMYLVHEYIYSEYHLYFCYCYTLTSTLLFWAIPVYSTNFQTFLHVSENG